MRIDALGDVGGKGIAVDGQGPAGGNGRGVGGFHEQRPATPQFLLEAPHGVVHAGAPQAVGADQLGQLRGAVSRRKMLRLHFEKGHFGPLAGSLPGRFTTGRSAADDSDFVHAMTSSRFGAGSKKRVS